MQIVEGGVAVDRPIAFQEPSDFFGWWDFGAGNILPDKAKASELVFQNLKISAFLAKLDGIAESMDPTSVSARRIL
jgi:hypothetical protein